MKSKKLFVVKKYVWANSASHAIRLEKHAKPDDVWIDDQWKQAQVNTKDAIGYDDSRDEML